MKDMDKAGRIESKYCFSVVIILSVKGQSHLSHLKYFMPNLRLNSALCPHRAILVLCCYLGCIESHKA